MKDTRLPLDELRVIANPQGFAVYDSNRNKLSVQALDMFIRPNMAPMLQIALAAGNVDVVGKPLFAVVDPASGKPRVVRRIDWADGQHTDFPEPEKQKSVFNEKAPDEAKAPDAISPGQASPVRQNGPGVTMGGGDE